MPRANTLNGFDGKVGHSRLLDVRIDLQPGYCNGARCNGFDTRPAVEHTIFL